MDERDFFREITLRICGTLEIQKGIQQCFGLLQQYMPIDSIYLERFEQDLFAMRVVAYACQNSCEQKDVLVPLPEESKILMEDYVKSVKTKAVESVQVFNRPDEVPQMIKMQTILGEPPSSVLSLPLIIEDNYLGAVDIYAAGKDRFEENHIRLFSMLREPFSIAMSNVLRYREVLRLKNHLAEHNQYLHSELRQLRGDEIIGARFGLKEVVEKARQVAPMDSPVLITGETGVGKDVIANAIHCSSSRSNGPYVKINCGAIADNLIDSELFGHEKGAFTGAINLKRGCFERAERGTVFLDEIGELPLQAQTRLLRVLQDKEIVRVGGEVTINLNVRVIAATNRNLVEMVKNGHFREDLWFRLNVFPIWVPPLRRRKSDIPELVQYFIEKKSIELKLPTIPQIGPNGLEPLFDYHWPGNVRELANIIERELIVNPYGPIYFENITRLDNHSTEIQLDNDSEILKLDEINIQHIKRVLNFTKGKIHGNSGAAELLGINPGTLRSRMKKLGIK